MTISLRRRGSVIRVKTDTKREHPRAVAGMQGNAMSIVRSGQRRRCFSW